MAFVDIEKILYDGTVKINYYDKAHAYYRQNLVDGAWGKKVRLRGTTTILGDTLEKKGLMTWPLGMAMRELFGYYDFTNENGERMQGFSKGVGTLWWDQPAEGKRVSLIPMGQEETIPIVHSANTAWQRRQKKGADIGSIVHDAIEHYVKQQEFDLRKTYTQSTHDFEYESEEARKKAVEQIDEDILQAELAFKQFTEWWDEKKPELLGAEDLIYSKKRDYCGTFDGLIKLDGKVVLCDWKTSNAYAKGAPQGVGYDYFIQSAAYADAWMEMGNDTIDDLLIVSCRKDGGFDTKFASEVGLTVEDAINWWRCTYTCYKFMARTKSALIAQGKK